MIQFSMNAEGWGSATARKSRVNVASSGHKCNRIVECPDIIQESSRNTIIATEKGLKFCGRDGNRR